MAHISNFIVRRPLGEIDLNQINGRVQSKTIHVLSTDSSEDEKENQRISKVYNNVLKKHSIVSHSSSSSSSSSSSHPLPQLLQINHSPLTDKNLNFFEYRGLTFLISEYAEISHEEVFQHHYTKEEQRRVLIAELRGKVVLSPHEIEYYREKIPLDFSENCKHLLNYVNFSQINDSAPMPITQKFDKIVLPGAQADKLEVFAINNSKAIDINFDKISSEAFISLIKKTPSLDWVSLSHLPNVDDVALTALTSCKNLNTLILNTMHNITDVSIRSILENCPNLSTLHLFCCQKITDGAFSPQVLESNNLKEVHLKEMRFVTADRLTILKKYPSNITLNGRLIR